MGHRKTGYGWDFNVLIIALDTQRLVEEFFRELRQRFAMGNTPDFKIPAVAPLRGHGRGKACGYCTLKFIDQLKNKPTEKHEKRRRRKVGRLILNISNHRLLFQRDDKNTLSISGFGIKKRKQCSATKRRRTNLQARQLYGCE